MVIKSLLNTQNKSADNYVYIDESVMDIKDTTTPVSTPEATTSLLENVQDSKEENNNMLVTGNLSTINLWNCFTVIQQLSDFSSNTYFQLDQDRYFAVSIYKFCIVYYFRNCHWCINRCYHNAYFGNSDFLGAPVCNFP